MRSLQANPAKSKFPFYSVIRINSYRKTCYKCRNGCYTKRTSQDILHFRPHDGTSKIENLKTTGISEMDISGYVGKRMELSWFVCKYHLLRVTYCQIVTPTSSSPH